MEHDIKKAIEYGIELTDELGNILSHEDASDLKFSLGTSYALQGEDIDSAVKVLSDCAQTCPVENRGFILNNLGMSYFYKFVSLSS